MRFLWLLRTINSGFGGACSNVLRAFVVAVTPSTASPKGAWGSAPTEGGLSQYVLHACAVRSLTAQCSHRSDWLPTPSPVVPFFFFVAKLAQEVFLIRPAAILAW